MAWGGMAFYILETKEHSSQCAMFQLQILSPYDLEEKNNHLDKVGTEPSSSWALQALQVTASSYHFKLLKREYGP